MCAEAHLYLATFGGSAILAAIVVRPSLVGSPTPHSHGLIAAWVRGAEAHLCLATFGGSAILAAIVGRPAVVGPPTPHSLERIAAGERGPRCEDRSET
jgi:hypothetical protein